VRVCTHPHVCVYACEGVNLYVCVYIYIYTYVHTYTDFHICVIDHGIHACMYERLLHVWCVYIHT
jgi:hypothetical protein